LFADSHLQDDVTLMAIAVDTETGKKNQDKKGLSFVASESLTAQ
jgi:hypothetical protein